MKKVVFILFLVYVSSILNVASELYAQKIQAGWVHVTTEKEKIEKEKKEEKKTKEIKQKEINNYTHSVGITVGSSYGLAYKYFFKDNWALKVDATVNAYRKDYAFENVDFNPNIIYQLPIKTFKTCKLDFFAGGGTTLGYSHILLYGRSSNSSLHECVDTYCFLDVNGARDAFVWGLNGMLGLEINLAIPMTIEFDFRPGLGIWAAPARCNHSHPVDNKNDNYYNTYADCHYSGDYLARGFFDWSVNATVSYKF